MRKIGVFSIFLVLSLFLMTSVSAQPPFIQTGDFDRGYEISYPKDVIIKKDQDYSFSFHVFNKSNGVQISGSEASCYFYLYNVTGNHILQTEVNHFSNTDIINDWSITILGGNFSFVGNQHYKIQCNSTILGGFNSVGIEVTRTGLELTEGQALLYGFSLLGVLLVFFLSFYFAVSLPWVNRRNEDHKIIAVNKLKYLKLGLIPITYALFNWVLNLILVISDYLDKTQFYGFFEMMFTIITEISWVLAIVWAIIFLVVLKNDSKITKTLKFKP